MYAVVQTGGKQYRVTPGDYLIVERLPGENGDNVELNDILLLDNDGNVIVGMPFVKGASVIATIVNQNRADKIIVFKKKRRQGYRRKNGHRQLQSVLHISEIKGDGKSVKAESTPKVTEAVPNTTNLLAHEKKAAKAADKVADKAAKKAYFDLTNDVSASKAAPKAAAKPVKTETAAPKAAKAVAAEPAKKPTAAKKPAAKKTTDK